MMAHVLSQTDRVSRSAVRASARPRPAGRGPSGAARTGLRRQADRYRLLADPTRLAILEALGDGPREVSELATATGVHRNTVRAHLIRLDAAGVLAADPTVPSGRGRPALRYRLREPLPIDGHEFRVLVDALLRLLERAYHDDVMQVGEAEGYDVGRRLGSLARVPTPELALRRVMEVLRHLSFDPRLVTRGGVSEIQLRACPFGVKQGDARGAIVCAFHLGLIRGVAETSGLQPRPQVELLPHQLADACLARIAFAAQAG